MNRPIRRLAVVATLMFFALLANLTILSVVRADSLNNDPRNRRTREAEFAQDRGAIMVGNTPIASTKAATGRFKFVRNYSSGELYAPVTGYYSYDYARSGLEQTYNTQLSGSDDSQFFRNVVAMLSGKKRAGASVYTTIDARAQKAAAQALGDRTGAVVAIEPSTGAIRAMVSSPSYDPNTLSTTDLKAAQTAWKSLNADTDRPMANRATREIYPPGSTFKLVTAAAALENGMSADTQVASPSSMTLPQSTSKLSNEVDCGGSKSTIAHALQVSCNTAFANLGLTLGDAKLREQAQKFGFDSSYSDDLEPATSVFPDTVDKAQLAMSAIGQYEVAASPLQMAMVAAAIANDGQAMEPYLVQEVRAQDLSVISSHSAEKLQRAMSTTNAQALQQMMVDVVTKGTGQRAAVSGVTVGGKTGTAQSDPSLPPYAWFVGWSKDPDLAIAVFVEDSKLERSEIAGGRVAGPVFASVVEAMR